jgi:glycosyltransferase involved in cell wall biosynthesis
MAEQASNQRDGPVVHVITDAGPPGHPHPYFRTLIEAGEIERSNVIVGCVGQAGPLQEDMRLLGVRSFALGATSRAKYPLAVMRLARLLRRLRACVVQTHLLDGSLVGLAAARLARVPVAVMTAHHSHELPFHGRRVIWPERICTGPLCDHVIAPSRQVAETLTELANVAAEKVEVVHHGFDLDRLNPIHADRDAVRRELRLEGKLVLGAIGRLYWLKNYRALIEAFARVCGDEPNSRLVIVGDGERGPLGAHAASFGVSDRVLILPPRGDIPDVLAAFDAFVHPAIAESFGMVIIEAMALARPVMCTRVGVAPEVLEDGQTGVLAASPEPDSLAEGLRTLLSLRPRWPAIGQAARSRVKGFTARAMAERYEELYHRWLAE